MTGSTWTKPVIRLGLYAGAPFVAAANTPILHKALDQLVGQGRWLPRLNIGTFPVRFPSPDDPGDAGWHIDASFGTESPDFLSWRANVSSKGRALLMLFLFSDVGPDDAPTRIRVGSHLDVARMLAPAGEQGLSLRELAANGFMETASRLEIAATRRAGTVYLCHPFPVAQRRSVRLQADVPLVRLKPDTTYDRKTPSGFRFAVERTLPPSHEASADAAGHPAARAQGSPGGRPPRGLQAYAFQPCGARHGGG